jgi:hypothetical protein
MLPAGRRAITCWDAGYLDPANVDADGENLLIKLPARTTNGG